MAGAPRLTAEELAERADTTTEQIQALVELGLLEPDGDTFARRDVMRVRVIAHLEDIGVPAEAVAGAFASGHLRLGYFESAGRRHPRSERTFADLAEEIGLPFTALARIYVAFGLLSPAADELVRAEDLEALRVLPVLIGAGVTQDQVLRLARVWGDSVRRIARYLPHHFHTTVEEQFRRRGLGDNEAYEAAIREVGLRMGRSGEDLIGWLFRRHSEVSMAEHQFEHVEVALEEAGVRHRPPRELEAVVFADLSGFTRLTEESGDELAAEVSLTLAGLANEIAARHRGSVVKLLGDGVYLHFPDPADAVRASLELIEQVESHGLPPAHVGVNAGPMLYDEGDYFGRTVNLASRIGTQAGAGQVYVGEALADAVAQDGFSLRDAGTFELKGIARPVRIFEAGRP